MSGRRTTSALIRRKSDTIPIPSTQDFHRVAPRPRNDFDTDAVTLVRAEPPAQVPCGRASSRQGTVAERPRAKLPAPFRSYR